MVLRASAIVVQPAVRVLLKTLPQQLADFRGGFRGQSLPVRLAFQHGRNRFRQGLARKGALAGEQFV